MRKLYAHKLVVKTARDMAHALYEEIMSKNNNLYNDWKSQCEDLTPEKSEELFCEMMYPKLLEPARATLASMLRQAANEHLHQTLYEALCQDYILRQGRVAPQGRARLHVSEDGSVRTTRH